jgi:Flp pilus assembly protein TadB
MKKNVGSIDQVIRYLLAAILILLFVFKVVSGLFGYILLAVAVVFIVTALLNFCPIWWALGIRTRKTTK